MFARIASAFIGVSLAASASAAPLWQNVESEMTAAEIRKAQPGAVLNPTADKLGNGATCELIIRSLSVGGQDYDVCFFMLGGKLHEVMLTALHPSQPMFEATVDLLRGKYGSELAPGQPLCKMIGYMKNCEANWMLKSGVNISALMMQITTNEPIMNIVYQTRMAKDASKL